MAAQTLAEASSEAEGWSFSDAFRWQYLITPKGEPGPSRWKTARLGGWCLHHCPDLPIAKLKASGGETAALILGWAISPQGEIIEGEHRLKIARRAKDALEKVETFVEALAGRYVVFVAVDDAHRLYPDPICSLGPVFRADTRRAAASTALLIEDGPEASGELPAEALEAGDCRYLFGLTADYRVRRARPNHHLDLGDFTERRHWPRDDTPFARDEEQHKALCEEIGRKLALNIEALTGVYSTALPVSGSTDSRLLLATAKPSLDRITHFFVQNVSRKDREDVETARILSERMCLPLRIVSRESPAFHGALPGEELDRVMRLRRLRAGLEPDTAAPRTVRAMYALPEVDLILHRDVAEMTRALRWRPSAYDDLQNAGLALERLGIYPDRAGPAHAWYQAQYETWMATLPEAALPRIFDFVHCELWLPHSNGVAYMADTRHVMINPFNDRRLIHLTMQIPPRVRKKRRVINRVIRDHAPELKDVPYSVDLARAQQAAPEQVA